MSRLVVTRPVEEPRPRGEILVRGSLLLLREGVAPPAGYRCLGTLVVDGAPTVLWEKL